MKLSYNSALILPLNQWLLLIRYFCERLPYEVGASLCCIAFILKTIKAIHWVYFARNYTSQVSSVAKRGGAQGNTCHPSRCRISKKYTEIIRIISVQTFCYLKPNKTKMSVSVFTLIDVNIKNSKSDSYFALYSLTRVFIILFVGLTIATAYKRSLFSVFCTVYLYVICNLPRLSRVRFN